MKRKEYRRVLRNISPSLLIGQSQEFDISLGLEDELPVICFQDKSDLELDTPYMNNGPYPNGGSIKSGRYSLWCSELMKQMLVHLIEGMRKYDE